MCYTRGGKCLQVLCCPKDEREGDSLVTGLLENRNGTEGVGTRWSPWLCLETGCSTAGRLTRKGWMSRSRRAKSVCSKVNETELVGRDGFLLAVPRQVARLKDSYEWFPSCCPEADCGTVGRLSRNKKKDC